MADIAIILRRPPYSDINAAEAVRHALGAISSDLSVDMVLVDAGVMLAKKGQDDSGTGFTNLEAGLKDCIEMGIDVYADSASLTGRVGTDSLLEGIKILQAGGWSELLKKAKTIMIF